MPWTEKQKAEESKRQELGDRLVRNEVYLCVSGLISQILADAKEGSDLAELAMELSSPVLDYEEAAIQNGWEQDDAYWSRSCKHTDDPDRGTLVANTAQKACEIDSLDPYEWEIFEFWAVSAWLGDKLLEAEERVEKDFCGLTIWGRTTTGQDISLDGVIQRIALDTYNTKV